jgi:hypothetical protein
LRNLLNDVTRVIFAHQTPPNGGAVFYILREAQDGSLPRMSPMDTDIAAVFPTPHSLFTMFSGIQLLPCVPGL